METQELEFRISLCKWVLAWLQSGDPMLKEYPELVPEAMENYTAQLHELEEAREKKKMAAEPVLVGLGTAKLIPVVFGGRNGRG